jgi:hypothetical protein
MVGSCEIFEGCRFFEEELSALPVTAEMFRAHYCHGNHHSCARKMIVERLGRDAVPGDLFPNQVVRARKILSEA